jgi:nitrile hydratase accessory protein
MTTSVQLDRDVPRRNGELVFDEPWQSRAFGMALAMEAAGVFTWDDFRDRLKAETAATDAPYYERWLTALQRVVVECNLLDADAIAARAAEYRALERDDVF